MCHLKSLFKIFLRWNNDDKTPNKIHPSGVKYPINKNKIKLGENVKFMGDVILTGIAPIEIGDNSKIGINVIIQTSIQDFKIQPLQGRRINKKIVIGKNVWIGAGSIINPGVTIGDFAIIKAGSVIENDIPPAVIVEGNPAKVVEERDIEKILSLKKDKPHFKIVDSYSQAKYSIEKKPLKYFLWDRSPVKADDKIVFYDQYHLNQVNPKIKKKIAWLVESMERLPKIKQWIMKNNNKFDIVLTHNKALLEMGGNYEFIPAANCWILKENQKIYQKTKLLSIIASHKNKYVGHQLRHQIIKKFSEQLDIYGNGYCWIDEKVEGLKDYMFSVITENVKHDYYFTEKIIDCFRTGTVPIYWGCPSIGDFFDMDGIITFDNICEFEIIFDDLSPELYQKMLPHIKKNFKIAEKYLLVEDWLFENKPNVFEI